MAASSRHVKGVRGTQLTFSKKNVVTKSSVVIENDTSNVEKLNYSDDKLETSETYNEFGLAGIISDAKDDMEEIQSAVDPEAERPIYDGGYYTQLPIFDVGQSQRGTSIIIGDMDNIRTDKHSGCYLNHLNEEGSNISLNVNEGEREIYTIEDDVKSYILNKRSGDILRTSSLYLNDTEARVQKEHNGGNIARPVYVSEISLRKTCFPQLWARVQPVNREKKKLKGKRKRTKARKRKPNRCSTPFTIASWGTGFRSTSDISLVSAKSEKLYAGTYDIRYTSTSLILLNNRLKEELSRLRKDDTRQDTKTPKPSVNPERHSRASSSCYHHMQCFNSSSPRFVSSASMRWLNSVTPTRFLEKYSVNQHRHRKCLDKLEESSTLDLSAQTDTPKPNLKINILSPYAEKLTKK